MKREIKTTSDGSKTLYISELNENYHSHHGALQEARHVFIDNGLKTVQNYALEELRYSAEYQEANPQQQKEMEQQLLGNMKSITNIDEDAYIMVATNGLLGEKYLKVVPGGGLTYLKRGESIANTQGTMDLEDLITKFITGGAGKSSSDASKADDKSATTETTDAQTSFVE